MEKKAKTLLQLEIEMADLLEEAYNMGESDLWAQNEALKIENQELREELERVTGVLVVAAGDMREAD